MRAKYYSQKLIDSRLGSYITSRLPEPYPQHITDGLRTALLDVKHDKGHEKSCRWRLRIF